MSLSLTHLLSRQRGWYDEQRCGSARLGQTWSAQKQAHLPLLPSGHSSAPLARAQRTHLAQWVTRQQQQQQRDLEKSTKKATGASTSHAAPSRCESESQHGLRSHCAAQALQRRPMRRHQSAGQQWQHQVRKAVSSSTSTQKSACCCSLGGAESDREGHHGRRHDRLGAVLLAPVPLDAASSADARLRVCGSASHHHAAAAAAGAAPSVDRSLSATHASIQSRGGAALLCCLKHCQRHLPLLLLPCGGVGCVHGTAAASTETRGRSRQAQPGLRGRTPGPARASLGLRGPVQAGRLQRRQVRHYESPALRARETYGRASEPQSSARFRKGSTRRCVAQRRNILPQQLQPTLTPRSPTSRHCHSLKASNHDGLARAGAAELAGAQKLRQT
jgi:hypothetical protein